MPKLLIVERIGTNETHVARLDVEHGAYLIDGEEWVRAAGFWSKYRFLGYLKATQQTTEIES